MSSTRTLKSRVLALTGAGVFVSAAALSLLSRNSLLALGSRVGVERQNTARLAAGVLARDLVADFEVLQTVVGEPRLQEPKTEAAVWDRELAAAGRALRVGDGVCRADGTGAALYCGMNPLMTRVANPRFALAIREAIATRQAVVSPFVMQPDGTRDATAIVPLPGTDPRGGAIVEVISCTGSAVRRLFTSENGLSLASTASSRAATLTPIAGTPWLVSAAEPADVVDTIGAFRRRSLWSAPSLAALALLLAWGLVGSVRSPLAALTSSAERIAAGNLRDPVPGGDDEIGRLGTALENMRVRLKASIEDVERANAILERRVDERTSQLQRLLGKIISAQEDERRRIARELHDETSQVLTALGMALHLPGAMTPDRIRDTQALVERMHDGLHGLIVNLRPSVIDDLGLGAAIDALATSNLRRAGVTVCCELGELRDHRVDPTIEITIFRVVQEAVLNIVRHARASAVVIEGGLTNGRLWIDIEDDGSGFDPASIGPADLSLRGVGLIGMRERVEMLGGTFRIDSAAAKGTRVHLDVGVAS